MIQFPNKNNNKRYDLEERTIRFGEKIIDFCRKIKEDTINSLIIRQFVRAGTSIGANYCEANNASSKSDFRNKIYICKKETNETKYWIRMINKTNPELKSNLRELWKEAQELNMIFQKIVNSLNKNK